MVPDEKIETCSHPESAANITNFSDIEIIMERDTEFFFNGSLKFLRPLVVPWKMKVIAERWHRDQWVLGFEKKVSEACGTLRDPKSPVYELVKNQKECPLEPGVS